MQIKSKNPAIHALLLGGIALVAAFFLILGNLATKQAIADRLHEDLVRSLDMVIPATLYDNDLTLDMSVAVDAMGKSRKLHLARKNGKVTAVAFERTVNGYMSIHLVMAIDAGGEVLGVRVLKHEETPGLGDKIEVTKSDWIKSFDGLSLDNTPRTQWGVKKDGGRFDQFSGATITPRAVVKAVREGLEFFRLNKQKILAGENIISSEHNAKRQAGYE